MSQSSDPSLKPISLDYARSTHVSRLAKIAMWLSILSIPLFFLVVPALLALAVAWLAGHRIRNRPDLLAGLGFVKIADACALVSVVCFLIMLALPSGLRGRHELSGRSYCAANLRGIVQSMNIYATDHGGVFPIVPYAPYSAAINAGIAPGLHPTDARARVAALSAGSPHAGSVTASLWLLALNNQISPKQFVCKYDPWSKGGSAPINDKAGMFYDAFPDLEHLSYSFAYPWQHDGTPGKWWTDITDSSLPIASDMAPEQGTGTPARVLNPASEPADRKTWNSGNHQGDGMNVAYSDVHVEWVRKPTIGQNNDNIFTLSDVISIGPREFGGIPINKTPIQLHSKSFPFDIVMVPVRNESTGKL